MTNRSKKQRFLVRNLNSIKTPLRPEQEDETRLHRCRRNLRDGSKLNVFVELRAPNYPGSMDTLVYDPKQDQLRRTYFQATLRQSFDVYFVMK